jgi:hypothetical protein
LFFGIHIFLPLRLRRKGIKLNFSDPHLFGGLESIGILFKQSSGIYFIGLTIYLVEVIEAQMKFGPMSIAFFIGGWLMGFILFFLPQFSIHSQMKKAKREKLEELENEIKHMGNDKEGYVFPRDLKKVTIKEGLRFLYNYVEYNHADKIKLYPFDISVIRDLVLTAIIPISAEVIIRMYFAYIGI